MLHDREHVVRELRHTRAERLHGGQRPGSSLREALVVRFDAGVVLQGRQRGHVDHGSQLGPSAFRDRGAAGALATLSSRRLKTRQLDQLSTMTIAVKGRVLPVRRCYRRIGLFPDLFDFEAPHPPPAAMVLNSTDEVRSRARCDLRRGKACPEYGETAGCRDGLPFADDLGEHAVELMVSNVLSRARSDRRR